MRKGLVVILLARVCSGGGSDEASSAATCLDVGVLSVGPGADVDTAACVVRAGVVTGTVAAGAAALSVPAVVEPDGMPASSGDLELSRFAEQTIDADTTVDKLTIETGAVLTIDGTVRLHVTGDLDVNHAELVVSPGSRLELTVDGAFVVQRAAFLGSEGDASATTIQLSGSDDAEVTVGSEVWAMFVAPDAELTLDHSALNGAVAARHVEITRAAELVVDEGLICAP